MFRNLSVICLLGAPLVGLGCTGNISDDGSGTPPSGGSVDPNTGKPKPPTGPEGKPGAGALPDKDSVPAAAPVRRLTKLEYDNTIRDLLGFSMSVSKAAALTADTQSGTSGFVMGGAITGGDDARIMMTAGQTVSDFVKTKLGTLLPCSPLPSAAAEQDACVARFVGQFGKRAYRRPLTAHETELMQTLYKTQRGAEVGASFEDAVATLVGAIISRPSSSITGSWAATPPSRTATSSSSTPTRSPPSSPICSGRRCPTTSCSRRPTTAPWPRPSRSRCRRSGCSTTRGPRRA